MQTNNKTKNFTSENKLIAKFMGHELKKPTRGVLKNVQHYLSIGFPRVYQYENKSSFGSTFSIKQYLYPKDLKYHESWDWLMPVIEKIENTKECNCFTIHDGINTTIETWNGYDFIYHEDGMSKTKIESAYRGVIEFIEWLENK
jgi:hypothetical protein